MNHKRILIVIAILLLLGGAAFAAFKLTRAEPTGRIIMTREPSNSNCSPGLNEVEGCAITSLILYENGAYTTPDGIRHQLSEDQTAQLKTYITKTDFNAYKPALDPVCSSDNGTVEVYTFPAKTGSKTYELCKLSLQGDDPLYRYLEELDL